MAVRVIRQSASGESSSTCLPDPDPLALAPLADVKAHCKIDISDDDAYVTTLISVAIETVERRVQRAYLPRTFEWVTDRLHYIMRLPLSPVAQVRFVNYASFPYGPPYAGGSMNTLDPSLYNVSPDGQAAVICQKAGTMYPFVGQANEPVVVRFDTGVDPFGVGVSASVVHAIKLIVANLYEYRTPFNIVSGGMQELPLSSRDLSVVDALLYAERWQ